MTQIYSFIQELFMGYITSNENTNDQKAEEELTLFAQNLISK